MCDKSLLFLFLSNPEISGNQLGSFFVFHRFVTLKALGIERDVTTEESSALSLESNGATELSDKFTLLLAEDGVRQNQIVLNAFFDTDLSSGGVLEGCHGERQSGESLVNFGEEGAGGLHTEVVCDIEFSLVNSASEFRFLGLTLTSRGKDIKVENITCSEFELLNTLGRGLLVDNAIVTVNQVSLELVGKNTLNRLAFELLAYSGNSLSNFSVSGGFPDCSLSSQVRVVSSKNNISLATSNLSIVFAGNVGMSGVSTVSIEVRSDDNLANVALLDDTRLIGQWGEVAHDVVNRDGARESDTSLHVLGLLVAENFLDLFLNNVVDFSGNLVHISAWHAQLDGLLDGNIGDLSSTLEFVKDVGLLNECLFDFLVTVLLIGLYHYVILCG